MMARERGAAMRYPQVCGGKFIARPNRFIALVDVEGQETVCHVKNTGRCRELLTPGAKVILARAANPSRKTAYDLVAVYKGAMLINMDSQAPNQVAAAYLPSLFPGITLLRPEYRVGDSRLDFYVETAAGRQIYMEVKGCTLEVDGVAMFPDAPTLRGTKHLRTLTALARAGREAWVLLVVQMAGPKCFRPNDQMDPAFGQALREAAAAGVQIHCVDCLVTEDSLSCRAPVPVYL